MTSSADLVQLSQLISADMGSALFAKETCISGSSRTRVNTQSDNLLTVSVLKYPTVFFFSHIYMYVYPVRSMI